MRYPLRAMLGRGVTTFTLPTNPPINFSSGELPAAAATDTPQSLPIANCQRLFIEIIADSPGAITLAATANDPLALAYYNEQDGQWGSLFQVLSTATVAFTNRVIFALDFAQGGAYTGIHILNTVAFSAAVTAYAIPVVTDRIFP